MATVATVEVVRRRIRVTGTVQGVGFRPFVFRLASRLGLAGWVCNEGGGVLMEVEGRLEDVTELVRGLSAEPPPMARVGTVTAVSVATVGEVGFAIVDSSQVGPPRSPVSVDVATCDACRREVFDPADRRHRYPFTSCTDCGPRYTIVTAVPYDRASTTMAGFTMCDPCQAEYDDPTDRRFHAQPNACPDCGPRLTWTPVVDGQTQDQARLSADDALEAAVATLRRGGIVAIKGLGGFHLAVDATDAAAVGELRRRKARDDKPFAVMVADLDGARALCVLSDEAAAAVAGAGAPIVIARRRPDAGIAEAVAPGLDELGVLVAYTPLHHLLMAEVGRPLVMTSGNESDEPIAFDDDEAEARLGPLVDGVLGHDRPIHIRCDDSVVRATADGGLQVLRRSRGLAPEPIPLAVAARRTVLAVGAELKSTVALTIGEAVVASHHLGDLEHPAAHRAFRQAIDHLCGLYQVAPEVVAHDLHPEYLSSKLAAELDLDAVGVQHHHAHVAACLTEHGRTEPVLAVAFDGLGYGADGTLWGGELLVADLRGFERVGHLAPIAMPGGTAAIREPWRMAVAWAAKAGVADAMTDPRREAVSALVESGTGPTTTSMGRLFDAVAALLGGRAAVSYEAQAAIELEARASRVPVGEAPVLRLDLVDEPGAPLVMDPAPLVAELVARRDAGEPVDALAASFHESVGAAAAEAATRLAARHGLSTAVLTGGVFQNRRLAQIVSGRLVDAGLEVLEHRRVPPNDGGISIGQAAVAAATA